MKLQIVEHCNKRVLTTAQLAESFHTNSKVIARNFQRNKEHYTAGKHYFALSGDDLRDFKSLRQDDVHLKYVSVLYLWTEKGAWLQAKSLNNDIAWRAYQSLIDSYYHMTERLQLEVTDTKMTPSLIYKKFNQFESRLIVLEQRLQEVTLHSGEQRRLRNAVNERVYKLSEKETGARSALFRAIYSEIRERYEVDSYRDVKQHQLQDAIRFVDGWGGESIETRA